MIQTELVLLGLCTYRYFRIALKTENEKCNMNIPFVPRMDSDNGLKSTELQRPQSKCFHTQRQYRFTITKISH